MSTEPLLTYKTAAKILDCSAWKVQQLCLAGEIPIIKIGNEVRIEPMDLREWLDRQKHFNEPDSGRDRKHRNGSATGGNSNGSR